MRGSGCDEEGADERFHSSHPNSQGMGHSSLSSETSQMSVRPAVKIALSWLMPAVSGHSAI